MALRTINLNVQETAQKIKQRPNEEIFKSSPCLIRKAGNCPDQRYSSPNCYACAHAKQDHDEVRKEFGGETHNYQEIGNKQTIAGRVGRGHVVFENDAREPYSGQTTFKYKKLGS